MSSILNAGSHQPWSTHSPATSGVAGPGGPARATDGGALQMRLVSLPPASAQPATDASPVDVAMWIADPSVSASRFLGCALTPPATGSLAALVGSALPAA